MNLPAHSPAGMNLRSTGLEHWPSAAAPSPSQCGSALSRQPLCIPMLGVTTDGAHATHQSAPAPSLSARILAHWLVSVPTCRPALPLELFLCHTPTMPALLAHAELGGSGGTGVGSLTLLDMALALLQLM